eukprot:CAMPEP_0195065330 /NCGR_PEP_ID=MMETSP0448-20130528/11020_1 /TAXON_ID=66468 /ORGANISM="Heterocapsa triquestra, Strain CCMP 448" /LENGTH=69 /DNA_ID=CAMNT_0040096417 /DNA_START=108 /DNA_END=314 /DNA_ORIENTATION=+
MEFADVAAAFGSVAYPLGAIMFALYPVCLLLWTVAEGQRAAALSAGQADAACDAKLDGVLKPKTGGSPA